MEDNFCLSSSNSSNSNGYIFDSTEEYSEIVEKSLPIYQCMNTNFQEDDYWLIKDSMFSEYDMEQQYNNKLPLIDDFNASSLLPFNSLNFSSHDHAGATGDNNKLPLIEDISNALIEDDSRLMIENMFISDYVEKLPLIEDINASSSLSLSDSFNLSSHDHAGATDDTNKLPLIEDVTASSSLSLLNSFDLSSNHAGATNVNNNKNNNLVCKKKLPKKVDHWTREEHRHFLEGLICIGEGKWKRISEEYVATKTPTQVASHAQKYFKRQEQKLLVQHKDIKRKPRSSILDMTTLDVLKDNPAIMKMK